MYFCGRNASFVRPQGAEWSPFGYLLETVSLEFGNSHSLSTGMYALRERRQHVTQEDFEFAIAKVPFTADVCPRRHALMRCFLLLRRYSKRTKKGTRRSTSYSTKELGCDCLSTTSVPCRCPYAIHLISQCDHTPEVSSQVLQP